MNGGGRPTPEAVILSTATGSWRLSWQPEQSTFNARHVADRLADDRGATDAGHVSRVIGALPKEITSLGALEQNLGFALPAAVRAHLEASKAARPPALTGGRTFSDLYPGEHVTPTPPPDSERPTPTSFVQIITGWHGVSTKTYTDAMRSQPPLRTWRNQGFTVEILATQTDLGPEFTGDQALTYRLSHHEQVIFSGDDILAPLDVDPAGDVAIFNVVVILAHRDPDIPYSRPQLQFLTDHADSLLNLAHLPKPPYENGTHVVVSPSGPEQAHRTGIVVEAIQGHGETVTSYAWRPDAANSPDHPWHDNPAITYVVAADRVSATLPQPEPPLAAEPKIIQSEVIAAQGIPTMPAMGAGL